MSFGGKYKTIGALFFFAGWALGFLPIIHTWHNADPLDFWFRLLLLPLLIAFGSWAGGCGALWILTRYISGSHTWADRVRGEVRAWRHALPKRWPALLFTLVLGLVAWQQYGVYQSAQDELITYFVSHRHPGRKGYLFTRHSFPNWCSKVTLYKTTAKIDFDSRRDRLLQGSDLNMRISGAFRLERKTAFELDLSSDDGSILLIDGLRRLKMLGWHPSLHTARRLVLEPGWHSLELLYFQHQGGAQLKLAGLETLEPNLAPLSHQADFGHIWRQSRKVQWTHNRYQLLAWSAGFLFLLLLMPYPRGWEGKAGQWIWPRKAWLGALLFSAALLFFRLDLYPGMHCDEGLMGDSAFSQHWYGLTNRNLSHYAWSDLTAKLTLAAQYVMPLSLWSIRVIPALFQIAGLFLCGLALEKLFSRRAALIAVLLVGTAPWFLSSGRLALELVYSSVFISGAILYCLAFCRRHYLAGAVAGALLGLGVIIHIWWMHAAAGLGLAALVMRGKRLFTSKSFWLCLLGFFVVAYLNLGQFAGDKSGSLAALLNPERACQCVATMTLDSLPFMLSGEQVMELHNAVLLAPIYPLTPLIMLALLLYWPFAKLDRRHNGILAWIGLCCLGGLIVLGFIVPMIKGRFFLIIALLCYLWLAVYLDGLMARGARKIAVLCLALVSVYGAVMFMLNGPLNYNPVITQPYQGTQGDPAKVLWYNSQYFFFRHDLYREVAEMEKPVCIPNHHIRGALWFLERSDLVGRRGYVMRDEQKGGILIFHAQKDPFMRGSTARARRVLEGQIGTTLKPYELSSKVADKYVAYIIKRPIKLNAY